MSSSANDKKKVVDVSNELYHELFDYMRNGVAIYEAVNDGEDFVFVDFNRAAETIDGIKKEALIGKRVSVMFPGVAGFGLLETLRDVWRTGKSEYHPRSFYYDNRISGWRENYLYKLETGEVVAIYNDVTDSVALEERVTYLNKILLAIRNVNQTIVFVDDRDKMLQQICDVLIETNGYYGCWVILFDEAGKTSHVFQSGYPDADLYSDVLMGGDTPCINKLKQGEILSYNDSKECCENCILAARDRPQSILASYLSHLGKTYGVMLVTTPIGKIGSDELGLFQEVVGDIGFALYSHEQRVISEEADEERERFRLRLQALHKFAYGLSDKTSIEGIGDTVVDVIKRVIGYDHISFVTVNNEFFNHVLVAGIDGYNGLKLEINEKSILSRTYWSKKTQLIPDVRIDPDFLIGPAEGVYEPLSELCVPVIANETVIALINVESAYINAFSKSDVQLLEIIANHVSSALQNLEHLNEIMESEKKVRSLLDESRDGVTVNVDRKLVYVNNEFCNMIGYSREELLGTDILNLHTPFYREIIADYTKRRKEDKKVPSRYDVDLQRKDGKIITVEYQVSLIEWEDHQASLTMIRDVTEQKEYQTRLEALHNYSSLLSMAESIEEISDISLDFLDNVLGAGRNSFQIREGTMLRTTKTMPPSTLTSMSIYGKGVTAKVAREKSSILVSDTRVNLDYIPGGLDALSELAVPAILNDEIVAVLNIESAEIDAFNIRDQKIMEIFSEHVASAINRLRHLETLIELNREHLELEQAKILNDMKNQFVSTATHELRTPVTAIQGYVDLIREMKQDEVSQEVNDMLEVVSRNCTRLSELTNDLLDMQRLESGKLTISPKRGDINSTVTEIVEELVHQFNTKEQSILLDLGNIPEVAYDKNRISQVLINLLSNASKFSHADDTVIVKTWSDDSRVYVSVTDNGIGITEEEVSGLFKPFSNIKRTSGYVGSGLGLSISKGIIDLHSGKIWVESDGKDKGATFSFYLPIED